MNKISHNFWIKLLSLIVAAFCWLVITNMADPTVTRVFSDIPVEVLNQNVITSVNQVYEVVDGDTVEVTVKGKRSIVDKIKDSDFVATADLSKLSKVNAVAIDVALRQNTDNSIGLDWENAVLKVSLEKKISKQFKVGFSTEGDVNAEYMLGDVSLEPNIIEVSGGKSKIDRIESVSVVVSLSGETGDFGKSITPILLDKSGQALSSDNVTFSKDVVNAKVSVLKTKTVPVKVKVSGKPKEGYRLVQTDFKPDKIRVAGTKAELEKINEILIPIQIDGTSKDVEKEISIENYISPTLRIMDEYKTVSIRCDIEKEGKRTFTFSNGDINVVNMQSDLKFSFVLPEDKYTIVVAGKESVMKDLALTDLGAYLNMKSLREGLHTLPIEYKLSKDVRIKTNISVKVKLELSNTDTSTAPVETTEPNVIE